MWSFFPATLTMVLFFLQCGIQYVGTLKNGKRFDSGTIKFRLGKGEVIKGWDNGISGKLMLRNILFFFYDNIEPAYFKLQNVYFESIK